MRPTRRELLAQGAVAAALGTASAAGSAAQEVGPAVARRRIPRTGELVPMVGLAVR